MLNLSQAAAGGAGGAVYAAHDDAGAGRGQRGHDAEVSLQARDDGRFIETVLIPASPALYGSRSDRRTLCVSSQVGCAYDCKFCASGLAGFTRNLTAGEIVEQVVQVEKVAGERVDNLVFMGMGEPLANLTERAARD